MMTKAYMVIGGIALATYLGIAAQGVIFSGTDERPSYTTRSGAGRRGGGGGFFWGVGGYRGGK